MLNIRVSLEFGSKNATVFRTRQAPCKSTGSSRPSTAFGRAPDRSTRRLESRSHDFDRCSNMEDIDPALEVAKLEEFSANFNAPPINEFVPPLKEPATARSILRTRKQSDQHATRTRKLVTQRENGRNLLSNPSSDNKLSPYFDLFASGENISQKEPKAGEPQQSMHPEPKKIDLRSNLLPTNITGQMPLFRMLDDTRGLSRVKRFDQQKSGEQKKEVFYQPWTTQAMLLSASSEDSTSTTTSPRRLTLAQAFALKNKRKKASEGIVKPNKRTLDDRMVEDELTLQIKDTSDRIEMFHSLEVQKKVAVNDFCREYSRDLSRFDIRGKSVAQVLMEKTAAKSQSQDIHQQLSHTANLLTMKDDEETEQLARAKIPWVDKEEVRSLKKHIKILGNQKECLVQVKRKVLAQALKNYGKEINRMPVKDVLSSSQSAEEDPALYESKEQQMFGMQTQAMVSQHQKDSHLKPGFLQVQNRIFSLEFVILELKRCGQVLSPADFSCEIPTKVVKYLLERIKIAEVGQKESDLSVMHERTESAAKRPKSVTFSKTLSSTGWNSRMASATYSVKSALPSAIRRSATQTASVSSNWTGLSPILPMHGIPEPLLVWSRRVAGTSFLSPKQMDHIQQAATQLQHLKNEFVNSVLQDARLVHHKEQRILPLKNQQQLNAKHSSRRLASYSVC